MGQLSLPKYDVYFTTGETVGQSGTLIPDVGIGWQYTPPCVSLEWWPTADTPQGAPFTTATHWSAEQYVGTETNGYWNDKRGFLPFLDLPKSTQRSMELALSLGAA